MDSGVLCDILFFLECELRCAACARRLPPEGLTSDSGIAQTSFTAEVLRLTLSGDELFVALR